MCMWKPFYYFTFKSLRRCQRYYLNRNVDNSGKDGASGSGIQRITEQSIVYNKSSFGAECTTDAHTNRRRLRTAHKNGECVV